MTTTMDRDTGTHISKHIRTAGNKLLRIVVASRMMTQLVVVVVVVVVVISIIIIITIIRPWGRDF